MIVIYMGMKHIAQITGELLAAGRAADEPCAVVTNATTPDQQVLETTLENLKIDVETSGLKPPAIVCIGKSVLMRQALDWASMAKGEAPRNTDPLGRGRPAEAS